MCLTVEILARIFTGEIQHWDDPLIQQANWANQAFLAHTPVVLVLREASPDVSGLLVRGMVRELAHFRSAFGLAENFTDFRHIDLSRHWRPSLIKIASSDDDVDVS